MKQSPQDKKLDAMLRSSKIVAGGFMGDDPRTVDEIIDADAATLAHLGYTQQQVSDRMQQITDQAIPALGNWVRIDEKRQASVDEAKGFVVSPWPEPGRFAKRVTTLQRTDTDQEIHWADLNIHLIREHGFFEGKGAAYRLEPAELIQIIF